MQSQAQSINLHGANIFITGGAGFVGSHIADQALQAGAARITILDDLVRGRRQNLQRAEQSGRVVVLIGDVCDPEIVDLATAGADLVFHQAALRITHCADEPARAVQVMINGTQNVLDSAVRHNVRKVLAASSASVYGEPSYLPMDETHPFNNRTLYGAAKIANEQLLRSYAEMYSLRYLALRPFNIYGPRMDTHGVYTEVMIRWLERLSRREAPIIFGDGLQSMDFVHVGDVARAYLLAASSDANDLALNVGSGTETSLRELCTLLCEQTGHPEIEPAFQPARKVNAVSRRLAGVDLAAEQIGFRATICLPDGLRDLVDWYQEAREGEAVGAR